MAKESVERILKKKRSIVLVEHPSESYLAEKSAFLRLLVKKGLGGVYISFQRPFGNVVSFLGHHGVDIGDIVFVDVATAFAEEKREEHLKCVHVSKKAEAYEILKAVRDSIMAIDATKKFVFVDSLTTPAIHKSPEDVIELSKALAQLVEAEGVNYLILNVPSDLSHKKFVRDIAELADEVIKER